MTTAEILLSSGDVALVYESDVALVMPYRWNPRRCPYTTYAQTSLPRADGKRPVITMHRLITGALPGQAVDHDDGNGLNNQRHNLIVSDSRHANNRNTRLRKDNATGYRGVSLYRRSGKFSAGIYAESKRKHIGYFDTAEDAALAYDIMALAVFGDHAVLNGIVARDSIDSRRRELLREHAGQLGAFVQDMRIVRELLGGLRA